MKKTGYVIAVGVVVFIAARANAVGPGDKIVFEGKSAGQVVFDGSVHAAKGLACATCHEAVGILPALFEMKRGESWISMKKIERGRACGYCHEVRPGDSSTCSVCHKK